MKLSMCEHDNQEMAYSISVHVNKFVDDAAINVIFQFNGSDCAKFIHAMQCTMQNRARFFDRPLSSAPIGMH